MGVAAAAAAVGMRGRAAAAAASASAGGGGGGGGGGFLTGRSSRGAPGPSLPAGSGPTAVPGEARGLRGGTPETRRGGRVGR